MPLVLSVILKFNTLCDKCAGTSFNWYGNCVYPVNLSPMNDLNNLFLLLLRYLGYLYINEG